MMNSQTKKKVFVGLSGGVDSSVAASLLKKEGYDVTGVFIKVWTPPFMECTWKDDRLDAMRVSAKLDIPFITLDLEKEYKKDVVDYMTEEYKQGRVPNPDVMCNRFIKFGSFYDWAMKQGADYIATGHYASISKENSEYSISAPKDSEKDQTYFLWGIKKEQLPHILFPIGKYKKEEVRKIAKRLHLITADKKDSQGLCFLGKVDMKEFLTHFIETKKGAVINDEGEIIGEHDGSFFFTTGERRGFKINKKGVNDSPYYVVAKDLNNNTITVSHKSPDGTLSKTTKAVIIVSTNWLQVPKLHEELLCQYRYRQDKVKCYLSSIKESEYYFEFEKPQNILSPGQSLVLYSGQKMIGGGVIRSVL